MQRFNVIYADPAWPYRDKAHAGQRGVEYKYPVMTIEDICKLDVPSIATDTCCLFLWSTWPLLPESLRVMGAWGFSYKTVAFNWVKLTKTGKQFHWGMGNFTRANSEVCLLGVRGKPKAASHGVHQIVYEDFNTITIEAPVEKHSKKPDIVRDLIVQLCGDIPRVELFARETTPKWATWGNEVPCDITLGKQ